MRKKASKARDLALSAALCLVGIGFAYWIYPTLMPPPKPRAYGDSRYASELRDREGRKIFPGSRPLQYVLNPYTWYRLAPDQHLPWLNTDQRGFRLTPGSGGTRPISVLLGGSAAMGYGAGSDDETLSAQLQKLRPRESWVNAGVAGFGSGNELAELVHYADDLHPRIYVDFSGWNDFDADPERTRMSVYGFSDFWMSQVEERLSEFYLEKTPPAEQEPRLKLPIAAKLSRAKMLAPILATYETNLLKMKDFARVRGARFFVALQPKPKGNRNAEAYVEFCRKVAGFCQEKSLDCLDLSDVARTRSAGPEFYSEGVHLTAAGHADVARLISAWVDRSP